MDSTIAVLARPEASVVLSRNDDVLDAQFRVLGRVWLHVTPSHIVSSATPQLCGGKNGRYTLNLRHRRNDKPEKQRGSCSD